eukprot:SAG22_NODE_99_length_20560_cov_128.669029_27_plen_145_part_00
MFVRARARVCACACACVTGLWLDCMGVLGFQSHDACGGNVRGLMFNSSAEQRFGKSGYVNGQRMMITRIRALTTEHGASVLYANNVDSWDSAPELLKPHVLLDGGAKEGFIGSGNGGCGTYRLTHLIYFFKSDCLLILVRFLGG